MAISFVHRATGSSDGSANSTTSGAFTNTAGNCIIVGVMNDSTTAVTSVTDLAGNAYTKIISKIAGDEAAIWVAYNIKAYTNNKVSFANGNNDGAIWAEEWSGLATSSAADQSASATGSQTSGTITIGPTGTTTVANELVWALFTLDYASGQTLTAGSGFSNSASLNSAGSGSGYYVWGINESKTVSSTGTQSATATISNSAAYSWRGVVVTFKAQGGTTYNQSLTAGITPGGALTKSTNKSLTAGITPSGSLTRQIAHHITAGLTPTAALIKQTAHKLTAGLTPSGSLASVHIFTKALTATLTMSGSLLKTTNKHLTAGLTPSAALVKSTLHNIVAGLTPSGSLTKLTNKSLSATLGLAGNLSHGLIQTFLKLLKLIFKLPASVDLSFTVPAPISIVQKIPAPIALSSVSPAALDFSLKIQAPLALNAQSVASLDLNFTVPPAIAMDLTNG